MRVSDMRSVRLRIFRVLSHFAVIALSILLCLWMASGAKAATIKVNEVSYSNLSGDDSVVEVQLSDKISSDQIQVVYDRNFIQLEVQGASAYPAITRRFPQSESVKKAFAYQFKPDLARVRLFVDGKGKDWEKKTQLSINGETLRLSLKGQNINDQAYARTASVNRTSTTQKNGTLSIEEKELLEELKQNSAKNNKKAQKSQGTLKSKSPKGATENEAEGDLFANSKSNSSNSVAASTTPKSKSSIASGLTRLIFSLLVVLAVIGLIAYAFKKGVFGKSLTPAKQLNADVIRTLGNHSLGPNKSLMVVKIVDEVVVLGVTDHSINHVMSLDPDADFAFDTKDESSDFSIGQFKRMIQTKISTTNQAEMKSSNSGAISDRVEISAGTNSGETSKDLKSEIRKKISGFKPLT